MAPFTFSGTSVMIVTDTLLAERVAADHQAVVEVDVHLVDIHLEILTDHGQIAGWKMISNVTTIVHGWIDVLRTYNRDTMDQRLPRGRRRLLGLRIVRRHHLQ